MNHSRMSADLDLNLSMSSTTKNIFFARHGERIDWIDKSWTSSAERGLDPPLSTYGFQQAKELGVYIESLKPRITHIYASPYLRTIQTALQVAKELNKNVSSENEMTKIRLEPGFGEYFIFTATWDQENIFQPLNKLLEISEDLKYFDENYQSVFQADYYLKIGQENLEELRHRLKNVLECTLKSHADDLNILIITHAAPLIESVRTLMTIGEEQTNLSAWNMSPIRAGVCNLTHIQLIDNRWTLSTNGLSSYLSKGEQNLWFFPHDASLYENSS